MSQTESATFETDKVVEKKHFKPEQHHPNLSSPTDQIFSPASAFIRSKARPNQKVIRRLDILKQSH